MQLSCMVVKLALQPAALLGTAVGGACMQVAMPTIVGLAWLLTSGRMDAC